MAVKQRDIKKAIVDTIQGGERWLTDPGAVRGRGTLRCRVLHGKTTFWFRYTGTRGQVQLPIGKFTALPGEPEFDVKLEAELDKAEAEAKRLSRLYQEHKDLREWLAEQDAAAARQQAEAAEAAAALTTKSLRALLDAYVAHLARQGKASANEARNLFTRNIYSAFPDLAAKPAGDITHRDVNAILGRLIEADHNRTAGKVRAFMRAAYAAAITAEFDPTVRSGLETFNLTVNPVALIRNAAAFKGEAGERTLDEDELKALLKHLKDDPSLAAEAILLGLYLGGQRPTQLLRVQPKDVDLNACTLTLYDPKGRRREPRLHLLPLTAPALAIVKRRLAAGTPYLFAHDKVPLRTEKLSAVVTGISTIMVEDGAAKAAFQLHDIRRTVETMFSKMGISKDVKKHVLSHGFGGVQDVHYDKHDYFDEKKAVLDAWAAKLEALTTPAPETPSNVIPLRRPA